MLTIYKMFKVLRLVYGVSIFFLTLFRLNDDAYDAF